MAVFTVKVPEGELSKAIRQISAWDGKTRLRVEGALKGEPMMWPGKPGSGCPYERES